ncbi:MAG: M81 family metallopeptidase [Burkholderiaceae bacterium]|nr:M81 family metallopeptidase [Burkholderiaceae bacterium]
MRIAIGEFAHETNTFCPGVTELAAFKSTSWSEGPDILSRHRGVRDDLGGMIAAAERLGIELAPTLATVTQPSATIARHAYETIRDTLLARLQAAGPVDAICLALHGAGSAEGIEDVEGSFLAELRARVGPAIPIVVSLDLHGNTTEAMLAHSSAAFYCHAYPHVDRFDRGAEIIDIAARIVRGEIRPVRHLIRLPLAIPPSTTFTGPAQRINARCFEWEAHPGVLDCSFTHGFPHTDVSVICSSVLVTTDNDPGLARRIAEDVAALIVDTLEDFQQPLPGADEAIAQALAATVLPVIVAEVSDNPGGGAPGSGTHLLRALLTANAPDTCFGFIWDPTTAAQAHAAGAGATIEVSLGGFTDALHGAPIAAKAYVKSLTDGRFKLVNPMGAGSIVDLGPMARLIIGNVDVLVGSRRSQTLDAQLFLLHGIDVRTMRIVALKSQQHFRGGFQDIAGTIIRADTPGFTTSKLTLLPFRNIRRPIWPLDPLPGRQAWSHWSEPLPASSDPDV